MVNPAPEAYNTLGMMRDLSITLKMITKESSTRKEIRIIINKAFIFRLYKLEIQHGWQVIVAQPFFLFAIPMRNTCLFSGEELHRCLFHPFECDTELKSA